MATQGPSDLPNNAIPNEAGPSIPQLTPQQLTQQFFEAAQIGNEAEIRRLVALTDSNNNRIVDLFVTSEYGSTALHCMFIRARDNLEIIKYLISLKKQPGNLSYNLNYRNRLGDTYLDDAVTINCENKINYLLSLKNSNGQPTIDVNLTKAYDLTPLHTAVTFGYEKSIRLLLNAKYPDGKYRANINLYSKNKATQERETPLHIAARLGHQSIVTMLLNLKDELGNMRVDINKANILQFYSNDLVFMDTLRNHGYLEDRNPAVNQILDVNQHSQSTHGWYDIKCADINVRALLAIESEIATTSHKINRAQGSMELYEYVTTQIQFLAKMKSDNIHDAKYLDLVPESFRNLSKEKPHLIPFLASTELTKALERLNERLAGEWKQYTFQSPEGPALQVQTVILDNFTKLSELLGLMWGVFHHKPFIKSLLPADSDDDRVNDYIEKLEQAFVNNMLQAQIQTGLGSRICTKGFSSHMIHGMLESIDHPNMTKRNIVMSEYLQACRNIRGAKAILSEDLIPLMKPLTEGLLREVYKEPQRFEQLLSFMSPSKYGALMDKEDAHYSQYFGVRQTIMGYVKRHFKQYFIENLATKYPRTQPIDGDFIVLEDDYNPQLVFNDLNTALMDSILNFTDESLNPTIIPTFLSKVFEAIDKKEPLPELPEAINPKDPLPKAPEAIDKNDLFPEIPEEVLFQEWTTLYLQQKEYLLNIRNANASNSNEIEFQYALLRYATQSARKEHEHGLNLKKQAEILATNRLEIEKAAQIKRALYDNDDELPQTAEEIEANKLEKQIIKQGKRPMKDPHSLEKIQMVHSQVDADDLDAAKQTIPSDREGSQYQKAASQLSNQLLDPVIEKEPDQEQLSDNHKKRSPTYTNMAPPPKRQKLEEYDADHDALINSPLVDSSMTLTRTK